MLSRSDGLAATGVLVAILTLVGSFAVPEVRRWLGRDKSDQLSGLQSDGSQPTPLSDASQGTIEANTLDGSKRKPNPNRIIELAVVKDYYGVITKIEGSEITFESEKETVIGSYTNKTSFLWGDDRLSQPDIQLNDTAHITTETLHGKVWIATVKVLSRSAE